MKQVLITGVVLYFGWLEFSVDIQYWLPSWAAAFDSGYVWGQVVILGALAAAIFGTVIWTGYRVLSYILG